MRADAQAQPNIALIKYWGKRDIEQNLPAVGSLSVTLDSLWTKMSVEYSDAMAGDELVVNGASSEELLPRVSACLDRLAGENRRRASVFSESNFPIAAGLASSASAFAALVVAASAAAGQDNDALTLARIAGSVSGSAARSSVAWGGVRVGLPTPTAPATALRPFGEGYWVRRPPGSFSPRPDGRAMQRTCGEPLPAP